MADTTFVDQTTVVVAAWLNDVNENTYRHYTNVKQFGAVGNGSTNDSAAFLAADAVAMAAGKGLLVPPGTYRFGTNVTLQSTLVLLPGAILQPGLAILVTLAKAPVAGLYTIFDRSIGGAVQFIGAGVPEVWVEWWGATSGAGGRTDNEVPIQQAIDAVQSVITGNFGPAPNGDNNGGIVNFGYAADYLMSGSIHTINGVVLKGKGQFTTLKVNTGTWGASTEVWLSKNGVASQFGCRAENLSIDCRYQPGVRAVYAPAWQQGCGMRDCYVKNFSLNGIVIDNGYGGSAGVSLTAVDFSWDTAISGTSLVGVLVDLTGIFLTGWFVLDLKDITFGSSSTTTVGLIEQTGFKLLGRVRAVCQSVFGEGLAHLFDLTGDASVYGDGISAGGNPSTIDVVVTAVAWTGQVMTDGMKKAGATNLVRSLEPTASRIFQYVEPIFGRIVYPSSPGEILAYGRNINAAGVLESTAYGFSSISRTAAGQYTLTIDTTKFQPQAGTSFLSEIIVNSTAGRTAFIAGQTATTVDVVTKDLAGANADCDLFVVRCYGLGI